MFGVERVGLNAGETGEQDLNPSQAVQNKTQGNWSLLMKYQLALPVSESLLKVDHQNSKFCL